MEVKSSGGDTSDSIRRSQESQHHDGDSGNDNRLHALVRWHLEQRKGKRSEKNRLGTNGYSKHSQG
jgi:hypothetical protein